MRSVVIKTGVYGRRDEKGRVLPVTKGERVALSDEEAARLVALGVAAYGDTPARTPDTPHAPPPDGEEELEASLDTHCADPAAESATGGEEGGSEEIAKLERMSKADLEQMAADMGLDISGAKTKHDLAVLIVAAGEPEDGEAPLDLGDGDIVQ